MTFRLLDRKGVLSRIINLRNSHFVHRRLGRLAISTYVLELDSGFEFLSWWYAMSLFSDSDLSLGNKLLVYISCCLGGQAYPIGTIPADYSQEVKKEVEILILFLIAQSEINVVSLLWRWSYLVLCGQRCVETWRFEVKENKRTADEDVVKMLRYSNEMLLDIYQTKLESFQLKSGEMAGGKSNCCKIHANPLTL